MSVRAVAIRSGPRRAVAAVSVRVSRRRARRRPMWAAFADDRRLIRVKLILMGLLILAMMAVEVPL